jgi:hypothetical protein
MRVREETLTDADDAAPFALAGCLKSDKNTIMKMALEIRNDDDKTPLLICYIRTSSLLNPPPIPTPE